MSVETVVFLLYYRLLDSLD